MLSSSIISVAEKELGVSEVGHTNCGPRVNEYKAATDLPPNKSWPWCAAFVCWVVREAMVMSGVNGTATFRRPRTASAFDFENWSQAQDATTSTKRNPRNDIAAGDIVIFKFSHIGFATSSPDSDGNFRTIEGNTDGAGTREGGAVLRKKRNISQVRTRIRFAI